MSAARIPLEYICQRVSVHLDFISLYIRAGLSPKSISHRWNYISVSKNDKLQICFAAFSKEINMLGVVMTAIFTRVITICERLLYFPYAGPYVCYHWSGTTVCPLARRCTMYLPPPDSRYIYIKRPDFDYVLRVIPVKVVSGFAENRELSWCQLCCRWCIWRLSL